MSRDERRWCIIFSAVLAAATSLPYLWAVSREGEAWRFSGFLFGVEDGHSYIAKMLAGSYGAWLFRTPYTTAEQSGILAFLPYLVLGKLAAGESLHEQLIALFHAARVAAIPFGVFATYAFAARFLAEPRWRRWATIVATVGGGAGWLILLMGRSSLYGSLPLEFYSPETFGFLAYLGLPHLIVARGLLLVSLGWYLDAARTQDGVARVAVGLLLLGLFQPLGVIGAWAVMAAHVVIDSVAGDRSRAALVKRMQVAGGVILLSSPVVVYYAALSFTDPFVREWTAQNIIRSPHPIHYFLAYGVVGAVAILGLLRNRPRGSSLLLVGWILAFPVLAYAPVDLQRRLPDGVWVAWVILAVAALREWPTARLRTLGTIAVAAVSFASGLLLLFGMAQAANSVGKPAFVPVEAVAAYRAVDDLAEPGDAVLASFDNGNILPAWAPVRVPIGHGPESVGLSEMRRQVEGFFQQDTSDAARRRLLMDQAIGFVLFGPQEKELGSWDPSSASYLSILYSSDGYQLFAVGDLAGCDCGYSGGG